MSYTIYLIIAVAFTFFVLFFQVSLAFFERKKTKKFINRYFLKEIDSSPHGNDGG